MNSMMCFTATISNLRAMLEHIEVMAGTVGFSDKGFHKIQLASEEVLVNIINYAYPEGGASNSIEINCKVKKNHSMSVIFKDKGVHFNPLEAEKIDTTLPLEKRSIGGLGIFFFLNVMDDFKYERKKNTNILTITKLVS
jgi:anti-sigma regulatory factor (Ser/Thr protein kinase)